MSAPVNLPSPEEIIVIGADGCDLKVDYLNEYLSTGATVWQYSGNTIDFGRFDKIKSFVDENASKVVLAKSYSEILAAKQAAKVAMVVQYDLGGSPSIAPAHTTNTTVQQDRAEASKAAH